MQTQQSIIDDLKHQFKYGGMTMRLLFINVIIFLIIGIITVFGRLIGPDAIVNIKAILNLSFTLNTQIVEFLKHPWGLFTSIFAHFGFWHLLFNMIFLYFSGRIFEQLFDQKRLLYTYLLGGIAGGLFEILAHAVFPTLQGANVVIVGASASIMAIFIAIAFHRPHMKVHLFGIFPVRVIIIAAVFLFKDLLSLGSNDNIAHFAHLGGAVIGLISIQNLHSSGNLINAVQRFFDSIIRLFSRKKGTKLKVKKGGRSAQFKKDEDYALDAKKRQEEINRILDKISKSGYESLTKKEKDFLFNQSKNG